MPEAEDDNELGEFDGEGMSAPLSGGVLPALLTKLGGVESGADVFDIDREWVFTLLLLLWLLLPLPLLWL
ncbi:hypothetical protein SAMD00019534_052740 [Acytostelium subglobosum LB1]|uniref:hypothetical protein n=1 Tax=Acytostelium subglobosum LB1 TaxID=1410327 RepID=UPI000644E417|nr:hypothetical protein SAMD00019534_052740 [Acytostelium subglobosum LB1]GAM22099.1 hypothetical protein SAMD00019534_052740 [Acytostelium subglobosum LB1]|eukprot:XP_012755199.1 hypothetical protein SAMD00019534_052740 [Acytostelium subglobosum LB1]